LRIADCGFFDFGLRIGGGCGEVVIYTMSLRLEETHCDSGVCRTELDR